MEILATLRQSRGINALARQMGRPPAVITAAVNEMLPDLIERFRQCSVGMPGLLRVIEETGGAALAQAIMSDDKLDAQPGVMLLARIGNAGAISRSSEARAELTPELEARLMALLAMLVGGYLSACHASGGMSVEQLTTLLDARTSFYASGDEAV